MGALELLRSVIDRLTPIHATMERGLAAKDIERMYDDLVEAHGELEREFGDTGFYDGGDDEAQGAAP